MTNEEMKDLAVKFITQSEKPFGRRISFTGESAKNEAIRFCNMLMDMKSKRTNVITLNVKNRIANANQTPIEAIKQCMQELCRDIAQTDIDDGGNSYTTYSMSLIERYKEKRGYDAIVFMLMNFDSILTMRPSMQLSCYPQLRSLPIYAIFVSGTTLDEMDQRIPGISASSKLAPSTTNILCDHL